MQAKHALPAPHLLLAGGTTITDHQDVWRAGQARAQEVRAHLQRDDTVEAQEGREGPLRARVEAGAVHLCQRPEVQYLHRPDERIQAIRRGGHFGVRLPCPCASGWAAVSC